MLAKKAASPKLRGQYRRSVHAQRIRQEAQGEPSQRPVARPRVEAADIPPPRGRKIAPWVFLAALLPVLLIVAVGAYTINIVRHAETALDKAQAPTLVRPTSAAIISNTPRPTNTANPLGTIVPLPTDIPDLAATATIDPITQVNFDRKDPFTILLIGVDAREGEDDPPRSDTIILVYIDPLNTDDTVHMMSVPRDLLVTMPGNLGQAKMSDVYSLGVQKKYLDPNYPGVALVRDTLEQTFRVQIDFFSQVDFNGFRKIIDTIGGVTVDNPYPIKDDQYPTEDYQFTRVYFPAGIMHLYGAEALQYARTRHDDSDNARNARQQQVLLGIRDQALQLNLLSKATSLIYTLGDSIRTDFPIKTQGVAFAKFGVGVKRSAIRQFTLDDLLVQCPDCNGFYWLLDPVKAHQRAKEFSPKENKDFISGQVNGGLNKGATVVVENGTTTAGIANNWTTTLRQQGYANTNFIDAPVGTKGKVPKTRVLYFSAENAQTAQALAKAMGLSAQSVDGTAKRPPETPTADILILLGDDAHPP
jgi:LCP family protein required for cell wall assembly